jgi:hypothetical protein
LRRHIWTQSCQKSKASTRKLRGAASSGNKIPYAGFLFLSAAQALIRARTGEGRARAVARGVKMGRKPKLTPHQKKEALRRRDQGEAVREIARTYNVHNSTISRLTA